MAEHKGRRPSLKRRGNEFGRNLAMKRAFLRQAETLDRHEARIGKHTAIQSWTLIVSVLIGTVTTSVLIWIAWLQWDAARRQTMLEYARSANQFAGEATYQEPGRAPSVYSEFDPAHSGIPIALSLEQIRGENRLRSVSVFQMITISERPLSENSCTVFVANWFEGRVGREITFKPHPEIPKLARAGGWPMDDGTVHFVLAGDTKIDVFFDNVFGVSQVETLAIYGNNLTVEYPSRDFRPTVNPLLIQTNVVSIGPGPVLYSFFDVPADCTSYVVDAETYMTRLKAGEPRPRAPLPPADIMMFDSRTLHTNGLHRRG